MTLAVSFLTFFFCIQAIRIQDYRSWFERCLAKWAANLFLNSHLQFPSGKLVHKSEGVSDCNFSVPHLHRVNRIPIYILSLPLRLAPPNVNTFFSFYWTWALCLHSELPGSGKRVPDPAVRSFSRPFRIPNICHRYPNYSFLSQFCFSCQISCESCFPGSKSRILLMFLGSREYPSRWPRSPAPFHYHPESWTSVNAIPNTVSFCNPASRTKILANPAFRVAHPVSR